MKWLLFTNYGLYITIWNCIRSKYEVVILLIMGQRYEKLSLISFCVQCQVGFLTVFWGR